MFSYIFFLRQLSPSINWLWPLNKLHSGSGATVIFYKLAIFSSYKAELFFQAYLIDPYFLKGHYLLL